MRQKKFKNLLFLLFFYCSPLFVNNRTMEFLKIDKGTLITEFLCYFWNLTNKISILTKFRVHTLIFTEIMSLCCLSLFWSKMTSFWTKMSHSAAGENRGGLKIVMQTCFMGIYLHITTKTPYNI